jgi:hypothetical protein
VEEKKTPDTSLPDPAAVGFSASEMEWGYELWLRWRALGKPPQISGLMKEISEGYGGVISMLLEMESLYAKMKQQLEGEKPKLPHGNR